MLNKWMVGAALAGVTLFGGGVFAFFGSEYIEQGHVGIVKHFDGKTTRLEAGLRWVGWTAVAQEYPTFRQSLVHKGQADENNKGAWVVGTADQQELPVETNLNWSINAKGKDAENLYVAVGGKDIDYIRDSIVETTMKNVANKITHQHTWNDIKGKGQSAISKEIEDQLRQDLAKSGIEVVSFGFSHVGSPRGMEESQQALASAELGKQQALAEQEKQRIANTTAIEKAKADSEVKKIEAQATQQQAQALNELVVQMEWIKKWKGDVPNTVLGNGTNTFYNLGNK